MIKPPSRSILLLTLTVVFLSCADAHNTTDADLDAESQAVQPANSWAQASAPSPAQPAQAGSSTALPLNGIWHVGVNDPGIGPPSYIQDKHLGFVTWKLILSGTALTVLEYVPDSWAVTGDDPERFPYKKLKVKNVDVDPRGKWISFTIDRGYGTFDADESIEFNRYVDGEITGVYRVYDRYGGFPGSGPEYSGAIRLVPYGE